MNIFIERMNNKLELVTAEGRTADQSTFNM